MAGETPSLREVGGSLPVANVQELASRNLKDIPDRYIRSDLNIDYFSIDESLQVPVLDMSRLCSEPSQGYDEELARLHQACKEWGFFQVYIIINEISYQILIIMFRIFLIFEGIHYGI